ncbi:LON peptidase substrate-binding domain-containing protein [Alsobacter sp. SYSU M60028]|uniref:LON peptidase substrate-binding domain-containing protein n=1 Tax=Alsobacter ponti TaxID=2962936 RepID=A0ABT1LCD3_9HYPH|nr:LON peptidase substrate-binding domain-containing protein [Alsobacter ponti]MCP8938728.1 LON peptidase substrate-binding domain-containing protein [Alsobacter ponti]
MSMNTPYRGPSDCPAVLPLFPLPGALLLPRGEMPLNIFEPRYVAMIDEALRGARVFGMIQPELGHDPQEGLVVAPPLQAIGCAGRITQFAETGDGRYLVTLTGIARFRVVHELETATPFRQARVDFSPYARDFEPRAGEQEVDRDGVIRTLKLFVEANELKVDWKGIRDASNEALVNALAMMSPFEPREKQALLEAPDLKTRAEILIAITEMELARGGSDSPLQ